MLGVIVIVYTLTYFLPGSPPVPAVKAVALGLDKPYPVQLGAYIWGLFTRQDLGRSYLSNIPVAMELASRIPVTFCMSTLCIFIMLALGLPCGMV
jgi:peptide/nickel transport system permease protein